VDGRVVLLDATVAAASEQRAVGSEERPADGYAALRQPRTRLGKRDREHLAVGV